MNDLSTLTQQLEALSQPELLAAIKDGFRRTVECVLRLATAVGVYERRGFDLGELRLSILPSLRLIAEGRMSAEAYLHFSRSPEVLKRLSGLPLADQMRLAEGKRVSVCVQKADGSIDKTLLDPRYLSREQVAQVFGTDHLRDEAEQQPLVRQRIADRVRPKRERIDGAEVDRERGGVCVGKKFFPVSSLQRWLRCLEK